MDLLVQLAIGGGMIGMTVIVQAITLDLIIRHAGKIEARIRRARKLWQPSFSAVVVIFIFALHILNIWLWAGLFLLLDCLPTRDLARLLHFSTTSYTTLGNDAMELKPGYILLDGIESMNGIMMMGWTTAFIFEFISQIYHREGRRLED